RRCRRCRRAARHRRGRSRRRGARRQDPGETGRRRGASNPPPRQCNRFLTGFRANAHRSKKGACLIHPGKVAPMTKPLGPVRKASACPHDCPSTCALEVEVFDGRAIGRVYGAADNSYTAGVICAKVARYAERVHHKDRLLHPLLRTGPKGSGQFKRISWDEALDRTADAFLEAERRNGSEAVWPYYYAGTMGLVMRDG